jgi:hypothetical protein
MGKPGNLPTDNISTLKHMLPKKQADPPLWDMCCPDHLPPNKKWHRRSNLFFVDICCHWYTQMPPKYIND